jgi:hypothetical protein
MQQSDIFPHVRKHRRVVQHKDGATRAGKPLSRRPEVARKDVRLTDALNRKEPIRGLGVGPILARQQNALGGSLGKLSQDHTEPLS